ncbi:MAG: phage portal protein [Paludibacteraceae bacterium]|nr:phage portal protein [Paludibacteraceae bacterium]MBQ6963504.1 phage portal protein [Paludibacteraceae bacterium]MBQ7662483.1 phage portal protein [Prevotella sp.]MBQ7748294.1 phage portal protein [Paludibacteraceae bacterium]
MATIQEIIRKDRNPNEIVSELKDKAINVPIWTTLGSKKGLVTEYDPKKHPVMNKAIYPDIVDDETGELEKVTRITYNLQQLAVKRMTELCCGVPVKRVYSPEDDRQKEVSRYLERIYQCNRIDSVNTERLTMLFAGCEVLTLWYAVEDRHKRYGFDSPLKLRCKNFSPMQGDMLYPLFDEMGDMIALSIGYRRKVGNVTVNFFDSYTADAHYKWSDDGRGGWKLIEEDDIKKIGKIPAVYMYRPTPIWEDTSKIVYEMEWAMSRNGNYLRKNSKPLFCVFADEEIPFNQEGSEKKEFKSVFQYPKGSSAGYVTWAQAIENLKFYITELRQSFFTQLQLPDWSYESMKTTPMSGEARKQLFIDSQLKVKDESGRLLEFFDREMNVVKAFLKICLGDAYADAIDALPVENQITPFTISEEKDTISNLLMANGNKPLMSQREAIEQLGWSEDVDKTMEEIANEGMNDVFAE